LIAGATGLDEKVNPKRKKSPPTPMKERGGERLEKRDFRGRRAPRETFAGTDPL
jgi:hypothetical protein